MVLEREFSTFESKRRELCDLAEGKYVVIYGSDILGIVDNEEKALELGYEHVHPDEPFLVHRIAREDPIEYFTRPLIIPANEADAVRDIR